MSLGGASKHFLLTSMEMPEDVVMLGEIYRNMIGRASNLSRTQSVSIQLEMGMDMTYMIA